MKEKQITKKKKEVVIGKKKTAADFDKMYRENLPLYTRDGYINDLKKIKGPEKMNAIWQLGAGLGLEEDIPLLRKIAKNTEYENVRKEAEWAIEEIKKRAGKK